MQDVLGYAERLFNAIVAERRFNGMCSLMLAVAAIIGLWALRSAFIKVMNKNDRLDEEDMAHLSGASLIIASLITLLLSVVAYNNFVSFMNPTAAAIYKLTGK